MHTDTDTEPEPEPDHSHTVPRETAPGIWAVAWKDSDGDEGSFVVVGGQVILSADEPANSFTADEAERRAAELLEIALIARAQGQKQQGQKQQHMV